MSEPDITNGAELLEALTVAVRRAGFKELEDLLAGRTNTRYERIREELANVCKVVGPQLAWPGGMCDACASEGKALDGGPCMCGGTGRAEDAVCYLRERLFDAERSLTRLREAAERVARLEAPLPALLEAERAADATSDVVPDGVQWRIARDAARIQRRYIRDAEAEVLRLASAIRSESAPSSRATKRQPTNLARVTASAAVNSVQSGTEFGEAFARAAKGETP